MQALANIRIGVELAIDFGLALIAFAMQVSRRGAVNALRATNVATMPVSDDVEASRAIYATSAIDATLADALDMKIATPLSRVRRADVTQSVTDDRHAF
jgi:hypothetical protein